MGSNRRTTEDWPTFKQTRHGVSIEQRRFWPRLKVNRGVESSEATLHIAGYNDGRDDGSNVGHIRITRERVERPTDHKLVLARTFRASYKPLVGLPVNLGVGRCTSWAEAVEGLDCFDVVGAVAEAGKNLYDRSLWKAVRPIKVVYPYKDPREPNAIYSPFKLVGDYRLEEADNGCVVMAFAPSHDRLREIAAAYACNALLVDDADDGLVLLHRDGMTRTDPITMPEVYARVLAGSQIDGY